MGELADRQLPWLPQVLVIIGAILVTIWISDKLLSREKVREFFKKHMWLLLPAGAITGFLQLEIANRNIFFQNMNLLYIVTNIILLLFLELIFYIITNRCWLSTIIFQVIISIISLINHYTLAIRGTPVAAFDVPSAGTALNIAGSLRFDLKLFASIVILLASCIITISLKLRKLETINHNRKKVAVRDAAIVITGGLFFWYVFFCNFSYKPANTTEWIWRAQYWHYGYAVSSIESIQHFINVIEIPEGYSVSQVERIKGNLEEDKKNREMNVDRSQKPDIILILNETFYDLSLISDYTTDIEVTPYIDSLDESMKGNVMVPTLGGGTNRSEYELLTGNSLQLMSEVLPFWSLNLKEAYSVVSVLKENGYSTTAFHCGDKNNYNRDTGYPDLGFDESYFLNDMENYVPAHGIYCSDQSNYEFMIDLYEKRDQEKPFFIYNLTIQNHISNDPNMDIKVHATSGFEEIQTDADMYFTCLNMSDTAFQYLTEYFSKVQRPVIICMMGDHAPGFVTQINTKDGLSRDELNLYEKITPLIVWSNYDLNWKDSDVTSLPYVVPNLLEAAGVEKPLYYDYMLQLEKAVPILTAYNFFGDTDGKLYQYNDETPFKDKIYDYWYMEYNGVGDVPNRVEELFSVK